MTALNRQLHFGGCQFDLTSDWSRLELLSPLERIIVNLAKLYQQMCATGVCVLCCVCAKNCSLNFAAGPSKMKFANGASENEMFAELAQLCFSFASKKRTKKIEERR